MWPLFQEASADRSRPGTRLAKARKGKTLHPHSQLGDACTKSLGLPARSGIDAMKRILMLALVRGAAPLLAPRHAVRSFARRPAPKKRPSVSMALCVAASRKRIYAPRRVALPTPSTRAQRLCREMPHADAIDARVDDTVSTQARPARRAEARTGYTTTLKREDHPAFAKSGRGSRRGGR